jgi:hypothetical protein
LNGVAVVLEDDGSLFGMGFVGGEAFMGGGPGDSDVVLCDNAIVEDGDDGGADELIVFEPRAVEDDVVNIPGSGRTGGVYERGHESVQGGGLTVGVGFVFVGIEDLDLVFSEEEDP